MTSWKSVYSTDLDKFFLSHPAFAKPLPRKKKRQSTTTTTTTNNYNTIDAAQSINNIDARTEFDRHVLRAVHHNMSNQEVMSQPARSPQPFPFHLMRPGSTPISPSPRTRRLNDNNNSLYSQSSESSIVSYSSSSSSSSNSSINSGGSSVSSRSTSASAGDSFVFQPTNSRRGRRQGFNNYSEMEAPKWATLDHQVRNRLNRMERDLKSIPEKVILSVQKKEVPLHYKKTAALMNQYKSLRSKRIVLEVRKTIVYLRFCIFCCVINRSLFFFFKILFFVDLAFSVF